MQLPALAIQQPNIGNALVAAEQIKSTRTRNRLLERKMDKDEQLTGLRSRIMGGGEQDVSGALEAGGGPTPQAAAQLGSQGPDMDLLQQYAAIDPDGAQKMLSFVEKSDARQREAARQQAETVARPLMQIESLPPEQRPMAYGQLLGQMQQSGQQFQNPPPPQYDPQWVQGKIQEAMTFTQVLDQKEKQRLTTSNTTTVMTPKGPVRVPMERAVNEALPLADDSSALQERVSTLVASGVPKNIAQGIAGGRYTTSRDPINGTAQVVDKATGKIVFDGTQGGQPTPGQTAPGGAPPANTPPGTDMAAGTGASGFFGNMVNTISDAFGAGLAYPQVEKASQALTNLKVRTQTAMQASVPGRPSNYLMEQLGKLSVTPNSLLQGDARATERLRQTRDMLQEEVARMETDILGNAAGFSPKQVAETRANVSQLKGLLKNYDAVVSNMGEGKGPQPGTVEDGYRFKGGDPADPNSWEQVR